MGWLWYDDGMPTSTQCWIFITNHVCKCYFKYQKCKLSFYYELLLPSLIEKFNWNKPTTKRALLLRTRLTIFLSKQIKLLFDTIETDWITWSSLPEIEILKVYAQEARIYRTAYAGKYKIFNYFTIL